MKMSMTSKIGGIVLAVMLALTTAGVAATFNYAFGVDDESATKDVWMNLFEWAGAEILPDNTETGENHSNLLSKIINGEEGMNTPGSYLNEEMATREQWNKVTYGSMDFWDDNALNSIFDLSSEKLTFMIYFPKATPNTKYIYTTSADLGEAGSIFGANNNYPTGTYIYPIYRTTTVWNEETGKWEPVITELGSAKSAFYENSVTGSLLSKNPAFDPISWVAGKQGTSRSDAIYAFVGESSTAYVDSATEATYYYFTNGTRGTRTVTSSTEGVTITITNSNGGTVASGTGSVSWTAARNTTYYVVLVGAMNMQFTIS